MQVSKLELISQVNSQLDTDSNIFLKINLKGGKFPPFFYIIVYLIKIFNMKNNLVVILAFLSFQIFSQVTKRKATLFFKDGKELSCYARISGDYIRYVEKDIRSAETRVDYKELNSIKILMNDNFVELVYKTEEGKTKPRLMELVNNGKMKLYRIGDAYESNIGFQSNPNYFKRSSASSVYFLQTKENKDIVFRFSKDFEVNSKKYFSDCNLLVEKIGDDDFRKKDISKIVIFYNENCGN